MQPDRCAPADRGQNLRLGKNLRIRADADFQILRPDAHFDQCRLDLGCLRRSGLQVAQAIADNGGDALAHRFGQGGIARGLFLDDPLNHRPGKGDAAGLDRLQVAWSKQMDDREIASGFHRGRHDGLKGGQALALPA
jgi:hypothetical protein